MKRKKFEKKLGFKKITVANLSPFQLKRVMAGKPQCTVDCTQDCFTGGDEGACEATYTLYTEPGTTHPL